MALAMFRSYLEHLAEFNIRGVGSALDATKFKIVLCNGSTFTDASSKLDVLQQVINQEHGFAPYPYNPTAGSWDATNSYYGLPGVTVPIAANSDGSIIYDRAVLIGNCPAIANKEVDSIDASGNKLNFDLASAHGLAEGDLVIVTPDSGGVVPTELLDSGDPQLLYVRNPVDTSGERSIQLALTNGGTVIDFGTGTLPIRVRYANGLLVGYEDYGSRTVPSLGTDNRAFFFNWGGGTASVNTLP